MSDKNQLIRFQKILESDRIVSADNFINLVKNDTEQVLKDYFDIKNKIVLKIEKLGDKYTVNISFNADRIKNFTYIPKN